MEQEQKKKGGLKKPLTIILIALPFFAVLLVTSHEVAVRHFQDVTCTTCHEMVAPIEKWQQSGVAKNHNNCASCHYDTGLAGWWDMTASSAKFLVVHFSRDPEEPLTPRKEPLFLEDGKEPAYWSHVPNHRCYQCHDAKNHRKEDMNRIHEKVVKNAVEKPCLDCHSHEMRNGQLFYEKVVMK